MKSRLFWPSSQSCGVACCLHTHITYFVPYSMLKFCSLRRGAKPKPEAPPLPAKRVSKSSSLRLQDVHLSDAQLLNVLKAQRARGPLILALSSPTAITTAIPEAEACHHCGTPYLKRKSQALQNGDTPATQATTTRAAAATAGELSFSLTLLLLTACCLSRSLL
ncbi:uncharacterized protein LOC133846011 [Drosophila sulfurigaster albostrigata]|uniref:uncharacterized protein LOC133846011 n=1 Tax=Drosophila sulfurigaster albostrigata TaxID=89887 RepID=UPI002D21B8F1|nr:uncharacterized protein LOC133846011 [Drosophila sulfurigaster albostrigata]